MQFLNGNRQIYAIAAILILAAVSFFFTSWFGFAGAILSACCVISLILFGFSGNVFYKLFGASVVLVGVLGAFCENPIDKNAPAIVELAARAFLEPDLFELSVEERQRIQAVLTACSSEGIASAGKILSDGATALYEPSEFGFFSWALKPKIDRKSCRQEAEALAGLSPSFKGELDRIMQN